MRNIGQIKNPLTVISIFAGIAEVSGTIVLPFISTDNQLIFIWFLMFFPTFLVSVFFLTLNFNRDALYAPSDYKDEKNFIFHRAKDKSPEEVIVAESVSKLKSALEEIHSEEDVGKLRKDIRELESKLEGALSTTSSANIALSSDELNIDLTNIGESYITASINKNDVFQDLLNSLYFEFLHKYVSASTYGKSWELVDLDSDRTIHKRGEEDLRTLPEVGIFKGKIYKVVLYGD